MNILECIKNLIQDVELSVKKGNSEVNVNRGTVNIHMNIKKKGESNEQGNGEEERKQQQIESFGNKQI